MTRKKNNVRAAAGNREGVDDQVEAGFRWLLDEDYNHILKAYQNRAKTGERAAYIEALLGVLHVFGLYSGKYHFKALPHEVHDWLEDFVTHLEDLNSSVVHPMFDTGGSAGLLTSEWLKRCDVVTTTELFRAAGMKRESAARHAILFQKLEGYSEKDVLSWCAEFRKGRVKNRRAAEIYERYMERLRSLSPEKIEKEARELIECIEN
jgi:hypothetical protein